MNIVSDAAETISDMDDGDNLVMIKLVNVRAIYDISHQHEHAFYLSPSLDVKRAKY